MKTFICSVIVSFTFILYLCNPMYALGQHTVSLLGNEGLITQGDSVIPIEKQTVLAQQKCLYCKPHSVLSGELGGNFASLPMSINYEYAFLASSWYSVFVRAGFGGNFSVRMVNAGTMLGVSVGGENGLEINGGIIGDFYQIEYGGYGRGLKPVIGLYIRGFEGNSVVRAGISFIFLVNQEERVGVTTRPIRYVPGISYGYMF